MWGEPSEAEKLQLAKSQLQACRDWAEAVEKENGRLKENLDDWKKLFFLYTFKGGFTGESRRRNME